MVAVCALCRLHHADGLGVDAGGGVLFFEFAVDEDAAGDVVSVALGEDVGADGGHGGAQRQRPRKGGVLDALRDAVEVDVVDDAGAAGAEHLVGHDFGVERFGGVVAGGGDQDRVGAERLTQLADGDGADDDGDDDQHGQPHPFDECGHGSRVQRWVTNEPFALS